MAFSTQASLLSVQQLGYRRADAWLFRRLDWSLAPGQLWWLRGQNGRGKTSLLRLLVQLTRPDEGAVLWADDAGPRRVYVGHTNALKDDLTVLESLQFLAALHGLDASPEACLAALRQMGMAARRYQLVRTLSQGQRRRVALARLALESQARVWVLDEPLDALDVQGVEVVLALLQQQVARGGSVLMTSHIPLALPAGVVQTLDLDGWAS